MTPVQHRFFRTLVVLSVCATAVWARDTEVHNGHEVAAKQVIVQLDLPRYSAQLPTVIQQLTALGAADEVRGLNKGLGLYLVHSPGAANVTALLNSLKNHPAVIFVEPDYIVKAVVTPNDPAFNQEWGLLNPSTPGADIGATQAWAISTGSTANVVGVVDTGIDFNHPDLAANVWSAPSAFTVNLSWGQITCPAGSHGYNAIARTCSPADDHGHGTHVSGTIGAIGNNGAGVVGVNWTTRIMGLKFIDSTGNGSVSDAIDAIEFGLQAKTVLGAAASLRVLSNSWGGSGYSQALLNEINRANTADVLFVVAAGNSGANNDTTPSYPAAYTAANIVTVAATTNTDGLASFSSYGRNTVHLGAPGVNILSTVPGSAYGYMSGTSMATPHVSGAAMLVLSKCSLNTAALKGALLSNVDAISSLQGITVTGGRLNVNRAIRSCAAASATGTASFVKTDTTTQGSWKGVYGAEGYNVINDSSSYPAYVAVTPSGNGAYTWLNSTGELRAPQKGASADHIAACWCGGVFTIDLNFTDTNTHQAALYLLDWDSWNGGRSQKVEILDAGGNVLDTRSVSGFSNGQYLVWNLSGHVVARITNLNASSNAVISGIFFGGAGATGGPSGAAAFVKTDSATQGSWKGVYGAEGYNVIGDTSSYPAYVAVNAFNAMYTWAGSSAEVRALQKGSAADRIASCWYASNSFTADLAFNDSKTHQVALYLLDWDGYGGGRTQRIDIVDANNGTVLDSRSASAFRNGLYVVWNLSGHVIVRVTNTNGLSNAVASGLFFGPGTSAPPAVSAAFVRADSTTSGSWKGVYGADGYHLVNHASSYPSYVTVGTSGPPNYTWIDQTTATRALQRVSDSNRIAACWYTGSSFTLDLNFTDANSHQLALYLLDWDGGGGRREQIDILDTNGNVLDTRSAASFANGIYLVWNVTGHVVVRVTNTNATNAVLSGFFFR